MIDYKEVFQLLGLEDKVIEVIDDNIESNIVYTNEEIEQLLYNVTKDNNLINTILQLMNTKVDSTNLNLVYKKTYKQPYLIPIISEPYLNELENKEILKNYSSDRESKSYIEYNKDLNNLYYPKIDYEYGYEYKLENIENKEINNFLIDKLKIPHYTFKDTYYLDCISENAFNIVDGNLKNVKKKFKEYRFKGPTTINSYKRIRSKNVDESQQKTLKLSTELRGISLGNEIKADYNTKFDIPFLSDYYNSPKDIKILDGNTINIIGFILLPYGSKSLKKFNNNNKKFELIYLDDISNYSKKILTNYDNDTGYILFLPKKKIDEMELNNFIQKIIPHPRYQILNNYSRKRYYNTTIIKNILEQFYYKQGYPPVDKKFNNLHKNKCITSEEEKKILEDFIKKYPLKEQTLKANYFNTIEDSSILSDKLYTDDLLKEIYKIVGKNDLQTIITLKKIDNALLYYAKISERPIEVINILKNIILSINFNYEKINNLINVKSTIKDENKTEKYKFVMYVKDKIDRKLLQKLYKIPFVEHRLSDEQYYVDNLWVGCDHELTTVKNAIDKYGKEELTGVFCKRCGNFISDLPFSIIAGFDSEGHLTYSAIDELLIKPLDIENEYIYKTILKYIDLFGLYQFTETDIKMIHNFVNSNIEKYDAVNKKTYTFNLLYKKFLYMIGLIVGSIIWFANKYNINITAFRPKKFKGYNLSDKESISYFKMMFVFEIDSLTSYYFKEHNLKVQDFKDTFNSDNKVKNKILKLLEYYIEYTNKYISKNTQFLNYINELKPSNIIDIYQLKSHFNNLFEPVLKTDEMISYNISQNYFEELAYYYRVLRYLGDNFNYNLQESLNGIRNSMDDNVKNNNSWVVHDTRYKGKNRLKTLVSAFIFPDINTGDNLLDKEFSDHVITNILKENVDKIVEYTRAYNNFKFKNRNSIKYSKWVEKTDDNVEVESVEENKLDKFRNFCFREDNLNIGKKHYFNNQGACIYCRYTKDQIEKIINSNSFNVEEEYETLTDIIRNINISNINEKEEINVLTDTELSKNELIDSIKSYIKNINEKMEIQNFINENEVIQNLFTLRKRNNEIDENIKNKSKVYTSPLNNIYSDSKYSIFTNKEVISEINLINKMRTDSLDNLKHIIKNFIIIFNKLKYMNLNDFDDFKKGYRYRYRLLYNDDKLRTDNRKYKTEKLKLHEDELKRMEIEKNIYNFNKINIEEVFKKSGIERTVKPFEDIKLNDDMNIQKIYNFKNENIKISVIEVDNKCDNNQKYTVKTNQIKSDIKYLQLINIFLKQLSDLLNNDDIDYKKFLIEFIREYYSYIKKEVESNDITEEELYNINKKKENKIETGEELNIQDTVGDSYNIDNEDNDDGEVYGEVEDGEPV